jgi:chemotaxis response regulator CheB
VVAFAASMGGSIHLLAPEDGTLGISDAPAEHVWRPSAGALFRSVARLNLVNVPA